MVVFAKLRVDLEPTLDIEFFVLDSCLTDVDRNISRQQTFCATGTMGLSGNLSAGEILEQIVHADRILAQEWKDRQRNGENSALRANSTKRDEPLNLDLISNVVFMGTCFNLSVALLSAGIDMFRSFYLFWIQAWENHSTTTTMS